MRKITFSGSEYFLNSRLTVRVFYHPEKTGWARKIFGQTNADSIWTGLKHGVQLFIKPDFSGWTGSPF